MDGPVNLIGYHLTFDAEFSNASDMALFDNAFINGDRTLWNNKEIESYVDYSASDPNSPYAIANGALKVTASPTPANGYPYTSGLLSTARTFSQNQGYFEMRAQVPLKQGFWSAFWMLNPTGYPEIDVMEQPFTGKSTEYWTHTSTPSDSSGGYTDVGADVSKGYHSYGFMWTANSIQYTFDGNYVGYAHVTPPELANLKLYLLANLAVGGQGSWPGPPVKGASADFSIDYIRAYSKDPAVAAVAQKPISSPDGAATAPKLTLPPPATPLTIGSGPDTLTLQVSEDAYNGDAQFTISVDGAQQGGVQTATAVHGAGQSQTFTVLGTFGTGAHTVTVNFLNNAGDAGGDRNLFVTGAALNGVAVPNAALNEYSGGPQSFTIPAGGAPAPTPAPTPAPAPTPTPAPAPTQTPAPVKSDVSLVVGSGPDSLVLQVAEDAYQGNAQFTVSVDGVQQGGVMTATALNSSGTTQAVTVLGSYGASSHTVTVNFINDLFDVGGDRNLFVKSSSLNGAGIPGGGFNQYSGGPKSFTFTGDDKASAPAPAAAPPALSVGAGTDKLVLQIAEDAYQGDAQFTVSVDGVQQGGVLTASALATGGQTQALTVLGSFGMAAHSITVNFLNDAYGGTAATDRNLYVRSASLNGTAVPGAALNERGGGPQSFAFTGNTPAASPGGTALPTVGSGPDTLVLKIAEDAYKGDAQFTVSVDGVQQGGVMTASASNAAGQTQPLTILGSFGAASHSVTVNFINDLYDAGGDRNLFVKLASLNGVDLPNSGLNEYAGGAKSFGFVGNSSSPAQIGQGPDAFLLTMSEDAYMGDAQFTVAVDGVQQGGVQTATASHAAGASQAFAVGGTFGPGAHSLTVNFLNDAWGGTPETDRNLYVTGISYNGANVPGGAGTLAVPGPMTFTIPVLS